MILINGKEYKSYAEAILELIDLYEELSGKIPDTSDFVKKEDLDTELENYAKESELSKYVSTSDSGYQKLLTDNDEHNSNWEAIVADLEKLGED